VQFGGRKKGKKGLYAVFLGKEDITLGDKGRGGGSAKNSEKGGLRRGGRVGFLNQEREDFGKKRFNGEYVYRVAKPESKGENRAKTRRVKKDTGESSTVLFSGGKKNHNGKKKKYKRLVRQVGESLTTKCPGARQNYEKKDLLGAIKKTMRKRGRRPSGETNKPY